ncbi:hypothetical protein ACEU07_01580 [Chromobacterium violaceum]|uniref:hypothetical protein n=1 Tax=Chromobacterium violaceum TaxID=536 RepID=UPI0035A713E7
MSLLEQDLAGDRLLLPGAHGVEWQKSSDAFQSVGYLLVRARGQAKPLIWRNVGEAMSQLG